MSISTLGEAMAVNTLLRYLLRGLDQSSNRVAPTADEAQEAAILLAKSAHEKMCAGINQYQVRDAWEFSELSIRRPGT